MFAVAIGFQNISSKCPGVTSLCDASCYNTFTHIVQWNVFTPEFQPTVNAISSPLALLVALWGMTSKLTLQLMTSNRQQKVPLKLTTADE